MATIEEYAGCVADARDVVETFRLTGVLVDDWDQTLQEASVKLAEGPGVPSEVSRELAADLGALREARLRDRPRVDRASQLLRQLVVAARVPGLPTPDDDDLGF